MKKQVVFSLLVCLFAVMPLMAQDKAETYTSLPRYSVIIDNDFCGDPDGLFQLAQHVLSPSCDIKGIIGTHEGRRPMSMNGQDADQAAFSCEKINEVLDVVGMKGKFKVVPGAPKPMTDINTPIESEGARLIVEEALKATPDKPLYVCFGGPLTDLASALLINPEISKNMILVWIGGQEYTDLGVIVPPGYSMPEYNLNLCIPAARVVFNQSDIRIWQIPRDVYRQCMYAMSELELRIKPYGKAGAYLYDCLANIMNRMKGFGFSMGETYILGDSPLVLMTALMSGFETDPASSQYTYVTAPTIAEDGSYRYNHNGRKIRVYTKIDTRLMFADMEAKIQLLAQKESK